MAPWSAIFRGASSLTVRGSAISHVELGAERLRDGNLVVEGEPPDGKLNRIMTARARPISESAAWLPFAIPLGDSRWRAPLACSLVAGAAPWDLVRTFGEPLMLTSEARIYIDPGDQRTFARFYRTRTVPTAVNTTVTWWPQLQV